MTLPALATREGLSARGADVSDVARVQAAIDDISALIHAETGNRWVDGDELAAGMPPVVYTVAYRVAVRMLDDSWDSEQVGPFQGSRNSRSRDAFLNAQDKADLAGAVGNTSGLSVLRMQAPWPTYSRDGSDFLHDTYPEEDE